MRKRTAGIVLLATAAWAQPASRAPFYEPTVSPDRQEIAFVSSGDIWRVASSGGQASLLVSNAADESRPVYSPDGKRLAFVSTRTGGGDIYILAFDTGEVTRITSGDGRENLDGWSRDGQWIYFHSSAGDISAMNDVYRVRASGGTPMPVAADRYVNEFFSAASPDGATLAINARGIASNQWWRKGHSHIDTSEIYLVKLGSQPTYERVTDGAAKEIWPMWAADGKSLFFVSDRTGVENLWRQPIGGTSKQVSAFKDGRLLWPSISNDGKLIVFERDFQIWKMDPNNGKASTVPITLRGAAAESGRTHQRLTEDFSELAVSPDGKKLAFAVRGEIFAASVAQVGDAQRITRSAASQQQITWSPDSTKIVYVSDRNGSAQIFSYDFAAQAESQITADEASDAIPRFSPDGKMIAFTRDGKSLWVYDLAKNQSRLLAPAETGRQPIVNDKSVAWSPDSKWVAYASRAARGFMNLMVVPAAGGKAEPISFLANASMPAIQWAPDGKRIYFMTAQRTEETKVARIDLTPRQPEFRETRFWELFGPPAKASDTKTANPATATDIVFDQVRSRLTLLPLGLDVQDIQISADGKQMLLTAESANQTNLYTYPLTTGTTDPPAAQQITSTSGRKSHAQFVSGGKDIFYLARGRVNAVVSDSRVIRTINLTAEMDIDFQQQKKTVFNEVWTYQRDHFFDDKFNGVDWVALKKQYEPLIAGVRTSAELYRTLNLMLGELNASHSGISRTAQGGRTTGYPGLKFDPAAYETKGLFVVSEVTPLSPAALAGLKAGDVIKSIDGQAVDKSANIDAMLEFKIGKRVALLLGDDRKVALQPATVLEEKKLRYQAWVESRRAYVAKVSGGRLGYVHIPDMSADSLAKLYVDLDTENHAKEGVVIDVRNNNGGFINAYALDVFSRRGYLTFLERGRSATPARSLLGQRSLELPTILVTNQHSLSDAEDFSEGYRRLKLGKVVGEPTAGWIVYTWNHELLDGSSLRLPRVKVFDNDGQLMEMHPRPVDVPVQRPVGESYTDRDSQLDAAARELLQQIESAKPKSPSQSGLQ